MESTHTTDINDLPLPPPSTDPFGSSHTLPVNIDEGQIRQLVNGIQEASLKGATRLRTSDIPQDPLAITVDKCVIQPDPIPICHTPTPPTPEQTTPYTCASVISKIPKEIQVSIIMALLTGATQLPIVSTYIKGTCTWIYTEKGGLSWMGLLLYVIVFGILWGIIHEAVSVLSR